MNIQVNEKGNIVLISVAEERLDAHNSTDLKTRLFVAF